jgi:hypothetical protein
MFYSQYNPEEDTKLLNNSIKGAGTDEHAVIRLLANRSNEQRQNLLQAYKSNYGSDLREDLKSELSGKLQTLVLALFETPANYDAQELHRAMKGLGTDEDTIIEIICSRSAQRLKAIKNSYSTLFQTPLEKDIQSETSGDLQHILVAILQCNRSDNKHPDEGKCLQDAKSLYEAGEGKWGSEESIFVKIFSSRSPQEIACISQKYTQLYNKTLLETVDKEFSGDFKNSLKTIVQAMTNPSAYFATKVNEAIKGWMTNNKKLIRIIVSRDEIDMPQIKQAYKSMYGKDLAEDIKKETSGEYKDLLYELISH